MKAERLAVAERERKLVEALKTAEKMILTCGVVFNYRLTDYIRDVIVRAESRQSSEGQSLLTSASPHSKQRSRSHRWGQRRAKGMRRIDSKFHIEAKMVNTMLGEKIQIHIVKTSNGDPIPEDEPLFLLRARDYLALPLLHKYREMCIQDGCTDYQVAGNDKMILEFEKFAREHRDRMKQPGMAV